MSNLHPQNPSLNQDIKYFPYPRKFLSASFYRQDCATPEVNTVLIFIIINLLIHVVSPTFGKISILKFSNFSVYEVSYCDILQCPNDYQ